MGSCFSIHSGHAVLEQAELRNCVFAWLSFAPANTTKLLLTVWQTNVFCWNNIATLWSDKKHTANSVPSMHEDWSSIWKLLLHLVFNCKNGRRSAMRQNSGPSPVYDVCLPDHFLFGTETISSVAVMLVFVAISVVDGQFSPKTVKARTNQFGRQSIDGKELPLRKFPWTQFWQSSQHSFLLLCSSEKRIDWPPQHRMKRRLACDHLNSIPEHNLKRTHVALAGRHTKSTRCQIGWHLKILLRQENSSAVYRKTSSKWTFPERISTGLGHTTTAHWSSPAEQRIHGTWKNQILHGHTFCCCYWPVSKHSHTHPGLFVLLPFVLMSAASRVSVRWWKRNLVLVWTKQKLKNTHLLSGLVTREA